MHLHLGGHLSWYDALKRKELDILLVSPTQLGLIVRDLGLPPGEISVVAINGNAAALEDSVSDDDRVELFPPIGGG